MDNQTMNEAEMRDTDVPWPDSVEALAAYVTAQVEREHDYGTCVYAMSNAAVAAFRFVGKRLGVTGFQASCADMDILRRTRGYEHGFLILNANDLLYPQYDLPARVDAWIKETRPQLAKTAREQLAASGSSMHPNVRAHMEAIAALEVPAEEPADVL